MERGANLLHQLFPSFPSVIGESCFSSAVLGAEVLLGFKVQTGSPPQPGLCLFSFPFSSTSDLLVFYQTELETASCANV